MIPKILGFISFIFCFLLLNNSYAQDKNEIPDLMEVDLQYLDLGRTGFIPDTLPKFPGGYDGVQYHIGINLRYPEYSAMNSKTGRVIVSHSVEIDGSINEVTVVQSAGKRLDKEVIRTVKTMKDWKPAIKDGEPVKVYYKQVVSFMMGKIINL